MIGSWEAMMASIEKRRDVDARFFKPTCLIAVIDGITDSSLVPSDLMAERVIERFREILLPLFPERAASGWRPFWHLSRDGAWIFRKDGRTVGPEDFGRERKPNSRRQLMLRTDHVTVPTSDRAAWLSRSARSELRAATIAMLRRDDEDCRRVADLLEGRGVSTAGEIALRHGAARSGQGFLQSVEARRAVEQRAMTVATELLIAEGWAVDDVSHSISYDLHARRNGAECFVEVKGTTGPGDTIQITTAEVAFANRCREAMRYVVVSEIALTASASGIAARGGIARVLEGWAPGPDDLSPISFTCRLPPASDAGL